MGFCHFRPFLHPYQCYVTRASLSPQSNTWTFVSPTVPSNRPSDRRKYELLEDVYSQDLKFPCPYVLPCPFSGQPDWKFYCFVGVSNELVLYGPPEHKEDLVNYKICNPITRQWISLPPHDPFAFSRVGFVTNVENGILTSYRVVRVEACRTRYEAIRFEVFVSEIGEWKNYTIPFDRVVDITWSGMWPTALNGILHWITFDSGIIAYDPYHKPDCVRFMELPGDMQWRNVELRHNASRGVCDVFQGRLRCFELTAVPATRHGFSSICVWILNDYSTEDWSLQHRINAADMLYDDSISRMHLILKFSIW